MSPAGKGITVVVNDKPHRLGGSHTLAELLQDIGVAARNGIAAAVNDSVVPRTEWSRRALANGDRVLVIRATQGG